MRILFVSTSSGSQGGGEFYLVYLAEALRQEGVETGLWLSSDPEMDGIASMFSNHGTVIRYPYINTYKRKTRSFSHLFSGTESLRPILEQWKAFHPDVLHLNKQCLEDGLDLLDLANGWDIPQGCTIHITQDAVSLKARIGRVRDWIARRALRRYRGELWAIARNRADGLQAFVGPDATIRCIPNGVRIPSIQQIGSERERMRIELGDFVGPEGPVAVSVGRLMEQKDPLRFLEIVGQWKQREPGLKAIWVGDGWLRDAFEQRIVEMQASDWIRCVGWQSTATPYLCLADVYVHPARFEGLPFALLEAMAHGLPCVISPELAQDLKDMPEETWIIADKHSGRWLEALLDRQFLEEKGRQTRALACEQFSLEAMASAYIRIYRDLLEAPK